MRGVANDSDDYWRAPSLSQREVFFVRVCSFTFEFHTVAQIELCLSHYRQKLLPSSRVDISGLCQGFEHYEAQRWFEQLPLYLREEPKRIKVVAALEEALRTFSGA